MRKSLISALVAAAFGVSALATAPAQAVRFGEPDTGNTYSGVGLMVMLDNGVPQWRCTGALVSATVFLTAGHCTEDPSPGDDSFTATARVYFDVEVTPAGGYPFAGGLTGIPYSGPDWTGALATPDTGDVGRVVLDEPAPGGLALYTMASDHSLDALATARGQKSVSFTVVGYGLQQVKPTQIADRIRMIGQVQLTDLRSALTGGYNIGTTNNPGKGTGGSGTCFGDSGGPVFYEGEIVGVNSFVMNVNCTGTSYAYRVDRDEVQAWVLGD